MSDLREKYGIKEDPRYPVCAKEARTSLWLFLINAVAVLLTVYLMTAGKQAHNYSVVFGLPGYLFWGIVVTHVAFVAAAIGMLRFLYHDMPLGPLEHSSSGSHPPDEPPSRAEL